MRQNSKIGCSIADLRSFAVQHCFVAVVVAVADFEPVAGWLAEVVVAVLAIESVAVDSVAVVVTVLELEWFVVVGSTLECRQGVGESNFGIGEVIHW